MGMRKHQHVDHYIAELWEQLWEAFKETQVQSTSEAERQKWYYDRKSNAISLEPGDLVLAKANIYKGKRKVKNWWEEKPNEIKCQHAEGVPSYLMKKLVDRLFMSLPLKLTISHHSHKGDPSLYGCADWAGKVCHYHPGGANSKREWDWGSVTKCELSATDPVPDRWDSSKLGKQEALHIPLDVFWSLLARSRMKSSM